jgi:probable phosphoglycerate mutase
MKAQFPDLYDRWQSAPEHVRFPEGESLQDVAARTADATRFFLSSHRNDTIVMVAHDSVNRVLLCQLLGLPISAYWRFTQSPCCINEIDIEGRFVRLVSMNDTGHLENPA